MPNQKGSIPVLVLLAVVGLLAFLAISSFVNFKEGGLFAQLYHRVNSSFASGPGTSPSPSPTSFPVSTNVSVLSNWSLVALPVQPVSPLNSSTILGNLLSHSQGSFVEAANWQGTTWSTILMGSSVGPRPMGTDFTWEMGHGYFVYSDKVGSFNLDGYWMNKAPTIHLQPGWNLLAFPTVNYPKIAASDIVGSLFTQGFGLPIEVASLVNNTYTQLYADVAGSLYGNDFVINPSSGYWVNVTKVNSTGQYTAPFLLQSNFDKRGQIKSATLPKKALTPPHP